MGPNNNIDTGGPGPLNLIFNNQFKWVTYNNIFNNLNNDIDPGAHLNGPQFQWAPTNNIDPGDPGL